MGRKKNAAVDADGNAVVTEKAPKRTVVLNLSEDQYARLHEATREGLIPMSRLVLRMVEVALDQGLDSEIGR